MCLGAEFNDRTNDWRPVIVIPTGWLLRDDPQTGYLTSNVSTPITPIDQEQLLLLCPEWRHEAHPIDIRYWNWKELLWEAFELGEERPVTWRRINHRSIARLQWLVQDFLVTTIQHRERQLRRYLNLYPGNRYHELVAQGRLL